MPLAVFVLGLTVFTMGTTEFMVAGLLPELSSAYGVSTSQAGLLITGFALGVVVGAPVVTLATTRIARKTTLIGLLVVFLAGQVLATFAPSFELLLLGRIVTATAHGGFFGIGAVVAAGLVDEAKRARAISIMFGGLTIATVAGVPLGTFVGQHLGWRASFGLVAVIAVVALAGVVFLVPRETSQPRVDLRSQLHVFRGRRLWLALVTTALSQGGLYAAYTYIAPLLTDRAGFSSGAVPPLLVLFGVGTFIGSLAGGWLADHALMPTTTFGLVALAAVLALVALASQSQPATIGALFLFGIGAFVINPALQTRVMNRAEGAADAASAANISAFNIGNAVGPWLAGLALSGGLGLLAPSWIGVAMAAVALVPSLAGLVADRRERDGEEADERVTESAGRPRSGAR